MSNDYNQPIATKTQSCIENDGNVSITAIQCATMTLSMQPKTKTNPYGTATSANYYYGGPMAFNYMSPECVYGSTQSPTAALEQATYVSPSSFYPHPSSSYYGSGPGQITAGRPQHVWSKRKGIYSSSSTKAKCIAPVFAALFVIFFLTTLCTLITWAVLSDGFKNLLHKNEEPIAEAKIGGEFPEMDIQKINRKISKTQPNPNPNTNKNSAIPVVDEINNGKSHDGHLHQVDHVAVDTIPYQAQFIPNDINKTTNKQQKSNRSWTRTRPTVTGKQTTDTSSQIVTSPVPWFMKNRENNPVVTRRPYRPRPRPPPPRDIQRPQRPLTRKNSRVMHTVEEHTTTVVPKTTWLVQTTPQPQPKTKSKTRWERVRKPYRPRPFPTQPRPQSMTPIFITYQPRPLTTISPSIATTQPRTTTRPKPKPRVMRPVTSVYEPVPVRNIQQRRRTSAPWTISVTSFVPVTRAMTRPPIRPSKLPTTTTLATTTTTTTLMRTTTKNLPTITTTATTTKLPTTKTIATTTNLPTTKTIATTTKYLPTTKTISNTTNLPTTTIIFPSVPSNTPFTRNQMKPAVFREEKMSGFRAVVTIKPRQSLSVNMLENIGVPVVFEQQGSTPKSIQSLDSSESNTFMKTMKPKLALQPKDVCITPTCVDLATHINKLIQPSVDPCQDFQSYVCSKIPQYKIDTGPIGRSDKLFKALVESASVDKDLVSTSGLKLFHAECLSQKQMDRRNIDSVHSLMLDSLPNNDTFDWLKSTTEEQNITQFGGRNSTLFIEYPWSTLLANVHKAVHSNGLMDINVLKNEGPPVIMISAPWGNSQNPIKESFNHLRAFAMLVGVEPMQAVNGLTDVVEFEHKVYDILPRIAKHKQIASMINVEKFEQMFVEVNLTGILSSYLSGFEVYEDLPVLLYDAEYFMHLSDIISEIDDQRILADFFVTKIAQRFIPVIVGSYLPRWKICLDLAKDYLAESLAAVFTSQAHQMKDKIASIGLPENITWHLPSERSVLSSKVWRNRVMRITNKSLLEKMQPLWSEVVDVTTASHRFVHRTLFANQLLYIPQLSYLVVPLTKLVLSLDLPEAVFRGRLGWDLSRLISASAPRTNWTQVTFCSDDVKPDIIDAIRIDFNTLKSMFKTTNDITDGKFLPGLETTPQQLFYISLTENICRTVTTDKTTTNTIINTLMSMVDGFTSAFACNENSSQRNELKPDCK